MSELIVELICSSLIVLSIVLSMLNMLKCSSFGAHVGL